jgi:hypothetical protein
MSCTQCTSEFERGARFCGNCGERRPASTDLAPPMVAVATSEPTERAATTAAIRVASDDPVAVGPAGPPAAPPLAGPAPLPPPAAAVGGVSALSTSALPVPPQPPPPSPVSGPQPASTYEPEGPSRPTPVASEAWAEPIPSAPTSTAAAGRKPHLIAALVGVVVVVAVMAVVAAAVVTQSIAHQSTVRSAFDYGMADLVDPLYGPVRADPSEKWQYGAAEPVIDAHIDGGRLFLLQSDDKTAYLTAVSLADGKRLWEEDLGSTISYGGTRVIEGHLIVVGPKGQLRSFNPGSGEKEWAKEFDHDSYLVGTSGGDLLVAVGDDDVGIGDVIALNLGSGEKAWGKGVSASNVSLGDSGLYVLEEEQITSYDTGNGDKQWSISAGEDPAFAEIGDNLLVSTSDDPGRVRAYGVGDGQQLWDVSAHGDRITSIGELDAGTALLQNSERMIAIDLGNKGDEKWSAKSLGNTKLVSGRSPLLIGTISDSDSSSSSSSSSSYSSSTAKIVVVDPGNGERLLNISTNSSAYDVELADGVAYGYDADSGKVEAYDLGSGERLWRYSESALSGSSGSSSSSVGLLAADNGVLVIVGDEVKMLQA